MKNFKMIITLVGLIIGFLPSQAIVANPLERGAVADFFNLFRQKAKTTGSYSGWVTRD
jgi:hypothetical protein